MTDVVGTTIDRYEVLRRVGAGGMGEVYEARDPELKRRVALKRIAVDLSGDPEARRRLIAEARNAARISHQGVAALHDVVHDGDDIYLVMEFVEGETLAALEVPLPVPRFLDIAVQAADAVDAAHRRDVVHGDIKPHNLMIGEDGTLKILDFGVAGLLPEARARAETTEVGPARPGSIGWTVGYAAPEVLHGEEADERSDLFSLGIVLFELLTGRHPFGRATPAEQAAAILDRSPQSIRSINPAVSEQLERIVLRLLAKDPDSRIDSAAELRSELEALRGPVAPERGWESVAIGGLLLLALVVSVLSIWRPWDGDPASGRFDASDWIIAVLPVATETGEVPEVRALNEGMALTLTSRLARLSDEHDLQVIPASTLREEQITGLEEARKELGVTLALNFSTHRLGDQIRVNASLVDATQRRQLDAATITGAADETIELEEEVALSVLRMLRLELRPQERSVLAPGTEAPGAYDYFLRGEGYLADYQNDDNLRNAIQLFREALRRDPDFARAHAALGRAYWYRYVRSNEPDWVEQAEQACRRAIELDELEPQGYLCLGTVLVGTGEPERATASFDRALELDPTLDVAYLGLGSTYESLNKPELAAETYRQAIALRPHYWAGYWWLGRFLLRRGAYREAMRAFEEVVRLAPDSYRGYSSLGVAHWFADEPEAARHNFERALEINPEDSMALSNLGTYFFYDKGDYAQAARTFERAVDLHPDDYLYWGNLADAYYWAPGERDDAARAYRRAVILAEESLGVNPRSPQTLSDLAFYEAMLGHRDAAKQHAQRALELAPEDVWVQLGAAKTYQRLDDEERALRHLETAIQGGYTRAEVRADPFFGDLADHPEFQRIVGGQPGSDVSHR